MKRKKEKNRVGRRVLETKQKYNFFFFRFPYSDRNEMKYEKKNDDQKTTSRYCELVSFRFVIWQIRNFINI